MTLFSVIISFKKIKVAKGKPSLVLRFVDIMVIPSTNCCFLWCKCMFSYVHSLTFIDLCPRLSISLFHWWKPIWGLRSCVPALSHLGTVACSLCTNRAAFNASTSIIQCYTLDTTFVHVVFFRWIETCDFVHF